MTVPIRGVLLAERIGLEDRLRAQFYRLFASFLSNAPLAEQLHSAAALEGDHTAFGQAIAQMAAAAAEATPETTADEYLVLFIGLGRGEFIPYGSYYLTGFLHEKPLARLRHDMACLGVARSDEVAEPEDHIAFLMELMAGLIDGSFASPLSLAEQRQFYDTHIGSWAPYFFRDLAASKSSVFYAALANAAREFLTIEERAFDMA